VVLDIQALTWRNRQTVASYRSIFTQGYEGESNSKTLVVVT